MLLDLAGIGPLDQFDFCIIGTGPAGLTTALNLKKPGARILLLEGGGMEWTEASQELYRGEVIGDPYFGLEDARLRYFGGASGHWSGWRRALDAWDFGPKAGFPDAVWPIAKADLDPYLARASEILEIDPIPDDVDIPGSGLKEIAFELSPPVRFGDKYADEIAAAGGIFLALDANVISLNPGAGGVAGVTVRSSDGTEREVKADRYILAAGGIENSRILLWSNEVSGGALVPNAAALGRYWMEHPHFHIGDSFIDESFLDRTKNIALQPAALDRLGVLNAVLRVNKANDGAAKQLVREILCVAPGLGEWAMAKMGKTLACGAKIQAAWEQAPRPENRVALSASARDRFGIPLTELHWRKSPEDLKTVRESAIAFGAYLAEADIGRVKLKDWVLGEGDYPEVDELAGYHHMGGTRLADDPAKGVVDRNCRVHGQSNLYVAGSSVFPSAGHANPTLTIVQLALRLADRLSD